MSPAETALKLRFYAALRPALIGRLRSDDIMELADSIATLAQDCTCDLSMGVGHDSACDLREAQEQVRRFA